MTETATPLSIHTGDESSTMSDSELVRRIRGGEIELFELVMRRFNRRMFLIARSILRSDAEAEDAVQESYIRGWRRLHEFRGPNGLGAWFARIVTNEALMRLRGRGSSQTRDVSELAATLADEAPGPDDEADTMQLKTLLERAIDALPQPFRTTYVLREVEQLSVAETATCLEVEEATVKSRVHRARRLLRRHLDRAVRGQVAEAFPFAGSRCDSLVAQVMARIRAESLR